METKKHAFIDALRGFAIIGVVAVHSSQWIKPNAGIFTALAQDGARGVQLFYIASALTLFMSMAARNENERRPITNFYIRRFFRIAPMFYLAMAAYLFLYGFAPRTWAPNGITWKTVALTALFANGWNPETITSVVPGGWSVAIEMTFYLILPFLFLILKDFRSALLFTLASLVLAKVLSDLAMSHFAPIYPGKLRYLSRQFCFMWFFSQLPVFGIGIAVYHTVRRFNEHRDRFLGLVLLALVIFLFAAFIEVKTSFNLLREHVLFGAAFGVFALSLYFYPCIVLVNPVSQWIGKVSFSVYLVQNLCIYCLKRFFGNGFPMKGNKGFLLAFFLVLAISVGISSVTYFLVEKPGIRLGRRLIRGWER